MQVQDDVKHNQILLYRQIYEFCKLFEILKPSPNQFQHNKDAISWLVKALTSIKKVLKSILVESRLYLIILNEIA